MGVHQYRRRVVRGGAAAVAAVGLALGLAWFQPWKLFVDHRVDERLPEAALASPAVRDAREVSPVAPRPASTTAPRPSSVLLSRGQLISHEHDTSGTVSVVRLADGRRVLTLADLDTSDGPDVHVWLTDAPVLHGERGWYVFDDGRHRDLGPLKGNLGNQVYPIPADVDLTQLTSVSVWCRRFDVSFGAAELVAQD